jgi:hypothetical protein
LYTFWIETNAGIFFKTISFLITLNGNMVIG